MDEIQQTELKKRYMAAVDSFIEKIKTDPNVIAVIVCGSLAYDMVWERSDIDMTVIVRDQVLKNDSYCILEDGILINVSLFTRSDFKRSMENMKGGSFGQSYFSKGIMRYSTDDSLPDYFEEMKQIGADDIADTVFIMACELVHTIDKIKKWLYVKKDTVYAQYYLLKTAQLVAGMEVCLHHEPPTREAIQRALALNPKLITPFYQEAMSHTLKENEIEKALNLLEEFLKDHLELLMEPVLAFMSDQQIKTVTLITKHFHMESHFIVGIFDYLTEMELIEKVSQTIRITPKSRLAVEELGYLYIP
jgi:hypothetical protein